MERAMMLLCYILHTLNALCRYCVIFMRVEGPCMECALEILCYIFRVSRPASGTRCDIIMFDCVIFFVCGTRSGVIVLYFPRVERALVSLYYILRVWRARAWNEPFCYGVIFFACPGPARGTSLYVIVL